MLAFLTFLFVIVVLAALLGIGIALFGRAARALHGED